MSYDNYTFDEQEVYISGVFLDGVQSVATNFAYPLKDELSLGYRNPISDALDGELNGDFSVNRLVVSQEDPVTGYFEEGVSGHLSYGENSAYVFQTGLISHYSCTCEINEIPQLDFTMETWGKVFGTPDVEGSMAGPEVNNNYDIFLPSPGDLEIQVTDCAGGHILDLTTNAVRSFEYNINVEWEPLTTIGSQNPRGFFPKTPVVVEAILTIELNDFIPPNFMEEICQPIYKHLTLRVNACKTDCAAPSTLIRQFIVPNGRLVEVNNFSDIDDVLITELVFRSTSTSVRFLKNLVGK